jgi:hypothetical protein
MPTCFSCAAASWVAVGSQSDAPGMIGSPQADRISTLYPAGTDTRSLCRRPRSALNRLGAMPSKPMPAKPGPGGIRAASTLRMKPPSVTPPSADRVAAPSEDFRKWRRPSTRRSETSRIDSLFDGLSDSLLRGWLMPFRCAGYLAGVDGGMAGCDAAPGATRPANAKRSARRVLRPAHYPAMTGMLRGAGSRTFRAGGFSRARPACGRSPPVRRGPARPAVPASMPPGPPPR